MEPAPTDKVTRMKVPRETHAFWQKELEQSAKFLRKFHRQGTKIVQRYVDDRGNTDVNRNDSIFRLNLFHSNVKTIQNALYGQLPVLPPKSSNGSITSTFRKTVNPMTVSSNPACKTGYCPEMV
jgi:hypothetical protein